VLGTSEVTARSTAEFKFVVMLDGNPLTFGKDTITELTIDGTRMTGASTGRVNRKIALTRE
jgi:hypothetical protein